MALTNKLKAIADAIRSKNGTTDQMTLTQMAEAISNIQVGGGSSGGSESVSGEAKISNVNTQAKVTFGEDWENYIAVWEYMDIEGWHNSGTNKNVTIRGMCVKFNEYVSVVTEQHNPSNNAYAMFGQMKTPNNQALAISPTSTEFVWKTLYALPDGYNLLEKNIRYTVTRVGD